MLVYSKLQNIVIKTIVLIGLISCVHQSSAVVLIEDDRVIERFTNYIGTGGGPDWDSFYPSSAFADWDHQNQTSMITSDLFSGAGSGYAWEDYDTGDHGYLFSVFDITFGIEVATQIVLEGSFVATENYFHYAGPGANVRLYQVGADSDPVLFDFSGGEYYYFDDQIDAFNFDDVLLPGMYRLIVLIDLDEQNFRQYDLGSTRWDFNANFTAVPLPAAGWMLGVAVLGLWRWRKSEVDLLCTID